MIQNNFCDLFDNNSFYQCRQYRFVYRNIKYNFDFYHEFEARNSFNSQIRKVEQKYQRRIIRFYQAIKSPTLFIRYISSQNECDYISFNSEKIRNLLKSFNINNEIIFVCNENYDEKGLNIFKVKKDENDRVARKFIDQNNRLKEYLLSGIFDEEIRKTNLKIYSLKQREKEKKKKQIILLFQKILRFIHNPLRSEYLHKSVYDHVNIKN